MRASTLRGSPARVDLHPNIDAVEVRRLRLEEKLGPAAIARQLGIGRASVYRVLGKCGPVLGTKGGVDADQA